jgi:anti-sigma B factor antagonist
MGSERLNADVVCDEDHTSLCLHGDLDVEGAEILRALVTEFGHIDHIDLTDVPTIDSSGLYALVAADARARQHGRRLTLLPPPPAARRIFAWTGLEARLCFLSVPA